MEEARKVHMGRCLSRRGGCRQQIFKTSSERRRAGHRSLQRSRQYRSRAFAVIWHATIWGETTSEIGENNGHAIYGLVCLRFDLRSASAPVGAVPSTPCSRPSSHSSLSASQLCRAPATLRRVYGTRRTRKVTRRGRTRNTTTITLRVAHYAALKPSPVPPCFQALYLLR